MTVLVGLSFENPDQIFETTEWYTHPEYNLLSTASQPNDIGILKLHRAIVYTSKYSFELISNDYVQKNRQENRRER